MRNVLFAIAATIAVTGCTTPEKTALVGGAAGAAIGGIANGWQGAGVGAAAGLVGGYLVGRIADRPGYCRYRDRHTGREYVERCS